MSRAFDFCLKAVFDHEGGEVNDSHDPGGHTNMGITQGTLDGARKVIAGLPESVSDLTRNDCARIYRSLYWEPIHGDELPVALALLAFDCAVNQGHADAKRFLQFAVGVTADGAIGPKTLAAAAGSGAPALIEMAARRMYDYMLLDAIQVRFGLGWSRRLMATLALALDVHAGRKGP